MGRCLRFWLSDGGGDGRRLLFRLSPALSEPLLRVVDLLLGIALLASGLVKLRLCGG